MGGISGGIDPITNRTIPDHDPEGYNRWLLEGVVQYGVGENIGMNCDWLWNADYKTRATAFNAGHMSYAANTDTMIITNKAVEHLKNHSDTTK